MNFPRVAQEGNLLHKVKNDSDCQGPLMRISVPSCAGEDDSERGMGAQLGIFFFKSEEVLSAPGSISLIRPGEITRRHILNT